jgi:hypothetical protein
VVPTFRKSRKVGQPRFWYPLAVTTAAWLTRSGSRAGDPSLRLKNGSAQDDGMVLMTSAVWWSNCTTTQVRMGLGDGSGVEYTVE